MNIPSKTKCFELIQKMKMMDHIIDHSIMVSRVALFLSLRLKASMPDLNTRLTASAALLHDITKTRSFETKEMHSQTGGEYLTDLGYPEVGNIVRQHVLLDAYESRTPVSESEIVNYADKRILHDQIVSLKKRMEYIELRYAAKKEFKPYFKQMKINTIALEEKIFSHLDIRPEQLSELLEHKPGDELQF